MRKLISQSFRFGAVGLVNTAIGLLSIYSFIFFFNTNPALANAIGYAIGLVVSFALNRLWTFSNTQSILKVLPRYLAVAGISYALNLCIVLIGMRYFGAGPYLIQLFGIAIYTPTMFIGCRLYVFNDNGTTKWDEKIFSMSHKKLRYIQTMNDKILGFHKIHRTAFAVIELFFIGVIPFLLAMSVLGLWHWDLSVPLVYSGSDDVWQLILTKVLKDTGWILDNPFLGAPDIAHWQFNPAAQTSALHSVIMLALSNFIHDAIKLQQFYYILNFSLISITSYVACRLLGIARFAAAAIAILFSFTSFRIGWMFYAFLANYFAVPLALVPVFWIFTGEFREYFLTEQAVCSIMSSLLRSKKFWISLVCVLLVTLSDGYYAFFTLLLLGFATAMRVVYGDIKAPASLLAPLLLIVTLISVALVISLPLSSYKLTHQEEFYPAGKEDPALIKHPFEAEVYSSSLKLLVAPIPEHRINKMGQLGQLIIDTSNAARKYPASKPIVSLGSIGSLLLLACLAVLAMLTLDQASLHSRKKMLPDFLKKNPILWVAVLLSAFIFLCTISGGIGSLVALIYPTIRAYDRFPLFLIFCLFVGAGAAITALVKDATKLNRTVVIGVTLALTLAGLYDQIPFNAAKGNAQTLDKFLSERSFVHKIETTLPAGSMVYQYPHSQYLSDSKYYGWGSFSHLRLYLHSTGLHWSNGASKNSPVENWHERIADLPIANLISEVESVGFKGFIIDRKVVPLNEYNEILAALASQGLDVLEDAASNLTFAELKYPGFRIEYDQDFREASRIEITDKTQLAHSVLPSAIDEPAFQKFLVQKQSIPLPLRIERTLNPEIFTSLELLTRGYGEKAIQPLTDMKGQILCGIETGATVASQNDTILLTLKNQSTFDWYLQRGKLPIRIGMHLRKPDGTLIRWDDGFRVPADMHVKHDNSVELSFPLNSLDLKTGVERNATIAIEFTLVQDGHAWFSPISCSSLVRTF
jgi:putative flippase GtrA